MVARLGRYGAFFYPLALIALFAGVYLWRNAIVVVIAGDEAVAREDLLPTGASNALAKYANLKADVNAADFALVGYPHADDGALGPAVSPAGARLLRKLGFRGVGAPLGDAAADVLRRAGLRVPHAAPPDDLVRPLAFWPLGRKFVLLVVPQDNANPASLDEKRVAGEIARWRRHALVIAAVEPAGADAAAQRRFAQRLAMAGANLVVVRDRANPPKMEMLGNVPLFLGLDRRTGNPPPAGPREPEVTFVVRATFSPLALRSLRVIPVFRDGFPSEKLRLEKARAALTAMLEPVRDRWSFVDGAAVFDEGLRRDAVSDGEAVVAEFYKLLRERARKLLKLFAAVFVAGALLKILPAQKLRAVRFAFPGLGLATALAAGGYYAWQNKSLSDDAYISFKYVKNWLAGNGLVYNIGERVEGYTNFLWVVIVGALSRLTGQIIPLVGLFANLACFGGNLVVVWLLGRRLSRPDATAFYFPLAALWLAVDHIFHSYGAIGLETMCASLLVNAAIYAWLRRPEPRGAAVAGVCLILATMTRPDQAIFYALFGVMLLLRHGLALFREKTRALRVAAWRAAFGDVAAFAAPFSLYVVYLIWKWGYYGAILPNTFYAKSVGLDYWRQGLTYGLVSGLSTNLLFLLPVFLVWAIASRDPRATDFRRFAGLSVPLYTVYVLKLGGDFMLGRFFLPLMPLILLGVEHGLHQLARAHKRPPAWAAVSLAALVFCTAFGRAVVHPDNITWGISDENSFYHVYSLRPLQIDMIGMHGNRLDEGLLFKQAFYDRGMHPVVAASGYGIIGYYSELPIVDLRGLIDPYVARLPLAERSRPGHEKMAPPAYLDYRQSRFYRQIAGGLKREYAKFQIGPAKYDLFYLWRYEKALMDRAARESPEFTFTNFPEYLDKNTSRFVHDKPRAVAERLREFDHYYFTLNDDWARRQPFLDRFLRLFDFEDGKYPPGTIAEGSFANAFVRPAFDGDFRLEDYQGETLVGTPAGTHSPGKLILPPFTIRGDVIGFLFAGATDAARVTAKLFIDDQEAFSETPTDPNHLRFVTWNVQNYIGRTARFELENRTTDKRLLFDLFFEAAEQYPD